MQELARKFDMGAMESSQHSHVPYVVIVLQHMEKWRAEVWRARGCMHTPALLV